MTADTNDLTDFLKRAGLATADETPRYTPLAGGVSSDIWRVDLARGPVCVKRALAKLKVKADWFAPVERNAFEVAWMETANSLRDGLAPDILAHDAENGMFAMAFLDPDRHPTWKEELHQGRADAAFARAVGEDLARVHAGTTGNAEVAERFQTDATFYDIRLEPYLVATGRAHPDLAARLDSWSRRRPGPAKPWSTAMSARRTSWSPGPPPSSWTPNAPGTAIRLSTWPFVSTTCF